MKNHILNSPSFTLIMHSSIQPVKIPQKLTDFYNNSCRKSFDYEGHAKMTKNGVLNQSKYNYTP